MLGWLGLACVLMSSGLTAQSLKVQGQTTDAATNLPTQRIGTDDLISVAVYDAPELTRAVRVGPDGMIRLPLLRQPVQAAGLMPIDLETKLADQLRAQRLLVDPIVTVTLVESRSRPISVSGAVRNPASFQAGGSMRLVDALNRAGGLDRNAGSEILVSRPNEKGELGLTQRIPVRDLVDGNNPALNLRLEGGEEIRVPEAGRVYVVGNVKSPGMFPVQDPNDTTVFKMLAMAGGVTPFYSKEAYIIRKEGSGPNKSEIPIQLASILERRSPDVPLQADDVLYIPDNKSRRRTITILDRVFMVAGASVVTALILH